MSDSSTTDNHFSSHDLALHAARRILDKGGEGVMVLRLGEGSHIFDYAVIAHGRSERQTATLAGEVYHFCKRHNIAHKPVEGELGWRVVDCYEVVVHALTEEARQHYDLERLWPGATPLDVEAELAKLPDPDDDLPKA